MKTWPCQHWAAAEWMRLTGSRGTNWPDEWNPDTVDAQVSEACEKRIGAIAGSLTDLNASDAAVRLKWCEITMNPLINAVLADKAAW